MCSLIVTLTTYNVNIYVSELILSGKNVNANNFNLWQHAVIMLGNQIDSTIGFIMNQQVMNIDYSQISRIYGIKTSLPQQPVYCGGPMATEKVTIIHSLDYMISGSNQMNDHCAITFNEQIANDIAQGKGPTFYKIMLGFCSWQPGQLDAELDKKIWLEDDYNEIVWSNYKRKSKMWHRIISRNANKASDDFLNSLVPY